MALRTDDTHKSRLGELSDGGVAESADKEKAYEPRWNVNEHPVGLPGFGGGRAVCAWPLFVAGSLFLGGVCAVVSRLLCFCLCLCSVLLGVGFS